MRLTELQSYLADLLRIADFDDYCINGMQVEGKPNVRRIVTGVSASERLFQAAIDARADAIIVHHGLFWRNSALLALTGVMRRRVKMLLENEIGLLAYHLPLDGHPKVGNNVLIARALGLKGVALKGISGVSPPLAAFGEYPHPISFGAFVKGADAALSTYGMALQLARRRVGKIFIVSGGGSAHCADAHAAGADTLLTGDLREDAVRTAEELKINLYAGGHYNTEKWGIRALGEHLAGKFRLKVSFIDIPNPV